MEQDLLLVPPSRLGAILSSTRRETGQDLAAIATKSGGKYDVALLDKIEKGKSKISESQIHEVANLYKVESGKIIPHRSHLVIDLDSQTLSAGTESVPLKTDSEDEILEQYLALLYLLRDIKPGNELTLRQPDLLTLEEALRHSVDQIEQELFALMTQPQVGERAYWLSQKFIIPSAGILVGLSAIGSVVLVDGPGQILSTPTSQAQTEILAPAPLIQDLSQINATPQTNIEISPTSTTIEDVITKESTATNSPTVPASPTTSPTAPASPTTSPTALVEQVQAPTIISPAETGRIAETLIAYDYKSKLPGWTYEFRGDRDGYRGLTFVSERRIEIYIDPGETPESVSEILAHEVGHAIDVTYMTSSQRNRWLEARNIGDVWWPGNGLSDFHVGAGDFAEAVAKVLVDSPSNSQHGEFTDSQLDIVREYLP